MVWCERALHYRDLLCKVIQQTQQRVFEDVVVPANEKILSIFEPHTDIIVKGARDVQYGHKINLATDTQGLVLHLALSRVRENSLGGRRLVTVAAYPLPLDFRPLRYFVRSGKLTEQVPLL